MTKKCCTTSKIAWILVVVGGLNWGLVGVFNFDLVAYIAGLVGVPMLATVIYVVVGIAAVISLVKCMGDSSCSTK